MDQIIIKDLLAQGIIGVNEDERHHPQNMLINVTLYTDITRAAQSDQITDCVNYSTMAKKLKAHAETAQRFTLEALAADLARLCLEHPLVVKVRIRVEKPGAVRSAGSVGVEIERQK